MYKMSFYEIIALVDSIRKTLLLIEFQHITRLYFSNVKNV